MTTYNEAQCPNCGGFKTTTTIPSFTRSVEVTRRVKPEAKPWRTGCVMFFFFPLLSVAFTFLLVVAFSIMGVPYAAFQATPVCLFEMLGVSAIPALVLSIVLLKKWNAQLIKETRHTEEQLPGRDSRCQLCGYNWHWDPSEPYPEIRVNTALIAKGEQRLRAEIEAQARLEAETRARAEAEARRDLEWHHWNQWNNPDNS